MTTSSLLWPVSPPANSTALYTLNLAPVPYTDPWASTYQEQIRQLAGTGQPLCVAYYYDETNNSSFRYRVYNMIQAIRSLDLPITAGYFTRADLKHIDTILKHANVLVICRSPYSASLAHAISLARTRGIPILFEVDDLVFDTRFTHLIMDTLAQPFDEEHLDFWFAYIARNGETARLCDAGITTNPFLATRLQSFLNKPVYVIPNFANREQLAISGQIFQQKLDNNFHRGPDLHIGYFSGTPSHIKDLALIAETLAQLLKQFPQVIVRLAGYISLPTVLKPYQHRIEYLPFTDFINLQRYVGETEINLVPLQNNEFTNCKSQLKYFEAALAGTITVATPTSTYAESIQHGTNGYLANAFQWYDVLAELIANFEATSPVIHQARQHALAEFTWHAQANALRQVFLSST